MYEKVLPMLKDEPRCGRLDWERASVIVNIGNTYNRDGDYENAMNEYQKAEKLGKDHLDVENGNIVDGMGIMILAMRAESRALNKAGKAEEAKKKIIELLDLQKKHTEAQEKQKAEEKAELEKAQAAEKEAAEKATQVAQQ